MRKLLCNLDRRTFVGGSAALGAVALVSPSAAFAETAAEKQAAASEVRNRLVGLQADLEAAEDSYHAAIAQQEAAQAAMETAQAEIDAAGGKIGTLQDHLGVRARGMYRSGSSTFLDFILGAATFDEFTQNWDILDKLNESDAALVAETKVLRESLEAAKLEHAKQEQIASEKTAEARQIQELHVAQVAQASTLMNSLDDEARALLEQEQAEAAAVAAQKQAEESTPSGGGTVDDGGTPNTPTRGNGVEVPSQGSVVSYALSRIGCPYIMGADGPDAFDCSGLVAWAYKQVGISLPHNSEALLSAARQVVSVSEARPGDVLHRIGHVGIAVGSGGSPYVHAPKPGAYVRDTDSLSWSQFTSALRF